MELICSSHNNKYVNNNKFDFQSFTKIRRIIKLGTKLFCSSLTIKINMFEPENLVLNH